MKQHEFSRSQLEVEKKGEKKKKKKRKTGRTAAAAASSTRNNEEDEDGQLSGWKSIKKMLIRAISGSCLLSSSLPQ